MRESFLKSLVSLVGLVLPCACSVIMDADRKQCSTDEDCAATASALGSVCEESFCRLPARWECLAAPGEEPESTAQGNYSLSFLVRDTVTQMPHVGLEARLCRRLQVDCAETASAAGATDTSGELTVSVPANFDGYVRFSGPEVAPTLYFLNPPVTEDRAGISISASSAATMAGLSALTGATPDPGLGVVLVTAFDCLGDPADGATISAPDVGTEARSFYVRNGLPSTTATTTDATGYSGIVNAEPGTVSFFAERDGVSLGSVTVLVQPSSQTLARIVPYGR